MSRAKSFAVETLEEFPGERLARCVGDRVNQSVETVPGSTQCVEELGDLPVFGYVAGKEQCRVETGSHFRDALAKPLGLVGKSQFGTLLTAGPGDATCEPAIREE